MDLAPLRHLEARVTPAVRLADLTTFRLGGPCAALVDCATPERATQAIRAVAAAGLPYWLLGGGSNLLAADGGLDRVVIRYASGTPDIQADGTCVTVSGATRLDDLAAWAGARGLAGLAFASGIPGTVGGAIAGNAGAFGQQLGDRVLSVTLLDPAGRPLTAAGDELSFAYRHSRLLTSGEIVLAARLRLEPGDPVRLEAERAEILELRRTRHPDWRTTPTAGSFFKNVAPTSAAGRRQSAGWFLEQAGAKSLRVGGARVFEKHANIIVGEPGCTARDVRELARLMADLVRTKFSIELQPEVRMLGW